MTILQKNTIDEWIYFFKNSEIKDEFKAKGLNEAREKLKTITMTPEQLAKYQNYLEILSSNASIAQTISFEKEYALKQQQKEFAKRLKKKGLSDEIIGDTTCLTNDEIDKLRNELNNKYRPKGQTMAFGTFN